LVTAMAAFAVLVMVSGVRVAGYCAAPAETAVMSVGFSSACGGAQGTRQLRPSKPRAAASVNWLPLMSVVLSGTPSPFASM